MDDRRTRTGGARAAATESPGQDAERTDVGRTELGDGLETSAIGFGAMALTPIYGGVDDATALKVLHGAVDSGVRFIDTADVYGSVPAGLVGPAGTNELLIAALVAQRREDIVLATKFGITGAIGSDVDPAVAMAGKRTRGDEAYVRSSIRASLARLGTDHVDLWYLHRPDPDVPVEDTVGFMAEEVRAGRVRHIGLSEVTADELRRAHAVHPIAAVQSEWSLWSRDVENSVVPACVDLGVGFVPYSPLGRGFLTGTLTRERISGDFRASTPRMGPGWDVNQAAVAAIGRVADVVGASNAQVCLAWLLEQGRRRGLAVVPIPGTRSAARVAENAAATRVFLDDDSMAALDGIAASVSGSRNIVSDPEWISSGRE